jgi:hypothetical protein
MTRGHQPYEAQERGPDIVRRLQDMEFPELGQCGFDTIIDRCWRSHYKSVECLAKATADFKGVVDQLRATALENQDVVEKRIRCERLVDNGLLQRT